MQLFFVIAFVLKLFYFSSGSGPDHSGSKYVLGFFPNDVESYNSLHVYISSSNSNDVNLRAYTPRQEGFNLKARVKFGQILHVEFNNSMVFYETGYNTNAIVIEADNDLVVYGINREQYSTDGFLALPMDVLGNEYYVVAWNNTNYKQTNTKPIYYYNIIIIISITNDTQVVITFPNNDNININYNGIEYGKNSKLTISLQEYQTFQIVSVGGGLTSTHIKSDKAVAVFSGNERSYVGLDGGADHLCEQLRPVNTWGKSLFMTSTPGRVTGYDYFVIHTSKINTNINITGNKAGIPYHDEIFLPNINATIFNYESNSELKVSSDKPILGFQFIGGFSDSSFDPSMISLPSIPNFSSDYVFEFPKQSAVADYKNYFTFVIKAKDVNGLLLDETPFIPDHYKNISGTDYVSGYKIIPPGRHTVRHLSPIAIFQGVILGTRIYESYGFPIGLRLSPINEICQKSNQTIGDLIDNDCDGRIDEEICDEGISPPVDDDKDGLLDEDCAIDFNKKQKDCRPGPADIVFLVDTSLSQTTGIVEAKHLIKYFINSLPLNENDFRLAILTYCFEPQITCNYSTNQKELLRAVDTITSTEGPTYTGKALDYVHRFFQNSVYGSRLQGTAMQMLILITDGLSSDRKTAVATAKSLRASPILLYAVGTGSNIAHDELLALARNEEYTFGGLHIKELFNTVLKHSTFTACSDCEKKSSSKVILSIVNGENFTTTGIYRMKKVIKSFVHLLLAYNKNISLALVLSAGESKTLFHLKNNISLSDVEELEFEIYNAVQPTVQGNFTEGILHVLKDILNNDLSMTNTFIVTFTPNSFGEMKDIRPTIERHSNISFIFVATNIDENCDNLDIYSTGTHPYNIYLIDNVEEDIGKMHALAAQTFRYNCDKMLKKLS